MPIQCVCPSCSNLLNVPERFAGKVGKCPSCAQPFTAPVLDPPDDVDVAIVATPAWPLPEGGRPEPGVQVPTPAVSARCPHCQGIQAFATDLAGQIVRCPSCQLPLQVPVLQGQPATTASPPKDPLEFANQPMIHVPERPRRRAATAPVVVGFIAAGAIGMLLLAGVCIVAYVLFSSSENAPALFGGAQVSTRERNQDYLKILECSYQIEAMIDMEGAWLDRSGEYLGDDLGHHKAANLVADHYRDMARIYESSQVEYRKLFVTRHRMDSKEWKPHFTKQYPERDVIFDEIKVLAGHLSDKHGHAIRDRLAKKHTEIFTKLDPRLDLEGMYNEHRTKFLSECLSSMSKEVENEVMKLGSIVRLRKKVMSK